MAKSAECSGGQVRVAWPLPNGCHDMGAMGTLGRAVLVQWYRSSGHNSHMAIPALDGLLSRTCHSHKISGEEIRGNCHETDLQIFYTKGSFEQITALCSEVCYRIRHYTT